MLRAACISGTAAGSPPVIGSGGVAPPDLCTQQRSLLCVCTQLYFVAPVHKSKPCPYTRLLVVAQAHNSSLLPLCAAPCCCTLEVLLLKHTALRCCCMERFVVARARTPYCRMASPACITTLCTVHCSVVSFLTTNAGKCPLPSPPPEHSVHSLSLTDGALSTQPSGVIL